MHIYGYQILEINKNLIQKYQRTGFKNQQL